jgi:O-succinylbenzoate synthase
VLREGVRGNPFARAGVETAAWDLEAHRRNSGIAALLGERLEVAVATAVPCGVALGIPDDRRPETLTRRVAEALRQGTAA